MDCDWWFLFELMRRLDRHGALKIILKDDQKHVPVLGWGMRGFGFIFLRRDWARDKYAWLSTVCRIQIVKYFVLSVILCFSFSLRPHFSFGS